jgi:arabinofuranan 3-O-arabinosyltransferase
VAELPVRTDAVRPVRDSGRRVRSLTRDRLVLAGLWLVLAAVVFLNSRGTFVTDIKPEVYLASGRMTRRFLSAWQSGPTLGYPSFNVGLAAITGFLAVPAWLGVPPEMLAKGLRLLLLTVGAWGVRRLYGELTADRPSGASEVGRTAAAVAYLANPYVVVAGSTLGILLPFAFLPWQTLALLRALADRGSWRWPAVFALCFVAMSGANAGVIPVLQLVSVLAVVAVVLGRREVPIRSALTAVSRCALLVLLSSAYWIVPSLSAVRAGATVVANSETLAGIANPSSAAEVLRGLGLWPLYGADAQGPWQPEFVGYLVHRPLVVASFALALAAFAGAFVSRGRLRAMALALVVVSLPVMVGLHPPQDPSPFGAGLRWLFDHVSAVSAFRTTNKAGAVLVLGLALLAAELPVWVSRRVRLPGARAALAATAAVVLALSIWPALTGNLYTSPLAVPDYWKQATADLDTGPTDQRVWFVPGEVLSHYRWTEARPDDLSNSLLERPALLRTVIPVTSPSGANLLAALDGGLNEGTLPGGTLSTASRYLGVGDLLVRNDVVWEDVNGGRPSTLQPQLNGDPGLEPVGNFGAPGQNTVSPTNPPDSFAESVLPPLQHYRVRDPRPITRAESLDGMLLVDGDGFALPSLQAAGLLADQPSFRYLGATSAHELVTLLGPQRRLELTDTNRRRTAVAGRLANAHGALLRPATVPDSTRTLFGPRAQTILRVEGGRARASMSGSAFGAIAAAAPENAFDGDLRTSWQFGDFGNGAGARIRLDLLDVRPIGDVAVTQASLGTVRIDKVTVRAGAVSRTVRLPDQGTAHLDLGGVRAGSLTLVVDSLHGEGFNRVGIADVMVPGVRLTRVARLPERLADLAAGFDAAGRAALASTPLDVLMQRAVGTGASTDDDEERELLRDFRLPDARTFMPSAVVEVGAHVPDDVLDRVAGYRGTATATSSSRAFDAPSFRSSLAFDGDAGTAWAPGGGALGQSLSLVDAPKQVDHVDIRQVGDGDATPTTYASRVRVELDGRVVRDADLGPGRTRVRFPAQVASRLRLTVLAVQGSPQGELVRFGDVRFGASRIAPGPARPGCTSVATLDGRPLLMRPTEPLDDAGVAAWVACGPVDVAAGEHRLRPADGWVLDRLVLRDPRTTPAPASTPELVVHDRRGPAYDIRSGRTSEPFLLVLGEGYDARWRAEVDGRDAGAPQVVDGYSVGWVLPAGAHSIHVVYGPQRAGNLALLLSLLTVLVCLVVGTGVVARLPRRRRAADAAEVTPRAGPLGRRLPTPVGWGLAVLVAVLLGGPWLAVAAVVVALVQLGPRPVRGRTLLVAALVALAAVPVVVLVANAATWGLVSATFVVDHPWPHRVAMWALLLLVAGVVRDEADGFAATGDRGSGTLGADE